MIIRKYTPADKDSILRLSGLLRLTPYVVDAKFCRHSSTVVPLLVCRQFDNPKISVYTAVNSDGGVIGFISFIVESEFSAYVHCRCASILFLAVDEQYQRQGVGGALLDYVFGVLRHLRVSVVRVGTDEGNSAFTLYTKKNFRQILTWDIYRIYDKSGGRALAARTDIKNYPCNLLLKRPAAWLYTDILSIEGVHKFLIKQTIKQLKNNQSLWLSDGVNSLLLAQDKARQEHYNTPGTLWTFSDMA